MAALLLFSRGRHDSSAIVLACAAWTKFFPLLFLPFLAADIYWREGRTKAARFVGAFSLASALINLPVLLIAPEGWFYFFEFNAERPGEANNLWGFFDPSWFSVDEINRLNALWLIVGLGGLLYVQRHSPQGAWPYACSAMLVYFFFFNKVYSPQYALWIAAMLAIAGASIGLFTAFSVVDVLYFLAQFVLLKLPDDMQRIFEAAVVSREVMFVVIVAWCVKRMHKAEPP